MPRQLLAGAVLVALVLSRAASVDAQVIVAQHFGNNVPSTETPIPWVQNGTGGVGSPTVSLGTPAWKVTDNSEADRIRYQIVTAGPMQNIMSPTQLAMMAASGWTASWNLEVVSNSMFQNGRGVEASVSVRDSGNVDHRYILRWGRENPGDGINPTGADLEIELVGLGVFEFPGAGAGFHRVDLIASPGSGAPGFYFDGVYQGVNFSGIFPDSDQFYWGTVSDAGTSEANWNLVQFAVPEPASAGLLGGLLLTIVARRGRHSV